MTRPEMLVDEGGETLPAPFNQDRCLDCALPPYVVVTFHRSAGAAAQSVSFCQTHAQAFWSKWKGTAVGDSATFRSPQKGHE